MERLTGRGGSSIRSIASNSRRVLYLTQSGSGPGSRNRQAKLVSCLVLYGPLIDPFRAICSSNCFTFSVPPFQSNSIYRAGNPRRRGCRPPIFASAHPMPLQFLLCPPPSNRFHPSCVSTRLTPTAGL
jgi:hypothetical protein